LYIPLDPEAIYLLASNPDGRKLVKRAFTIDTGTEKIPVEGHAHQNVAVKYLMKRRRSLIFTKDPAKVEKLFSEVPTKISIIGANLTKTYKVAWERVSTGEFAGARFTFTLEEVN
jgi:hypothetical protein